MKNTEKTDAMPKRWYERQPSLAEAVHTLTDLSDPVTTIVSESIITLANQEFKVMELKDSLRSIGSEKIMGMHKSKQRRRAYDQNPSLHKAINYIYVLPEPKQDKMANHVLSIIKYIRQYDTLCTTYNMPSTLAEIQVIADKYVNNGALSAERLLGHMSETLQTKKFGPQHQPAIDITTRLNDKLGAAKVDTEASKISGPPVQPEPPKPRDPTLIKERIVLSSDELNAVLESSKQILSS